MIDLAQRLRPYGAHADHFRCFAEDGPDLLPYATLLRSRSDDGGELALLEAVYEEVDGPLMFLVSAEGVRENPNLIRRLRRRVALRGDAPFLGVVEPGRLTLYEVGLDAGEESFEIGVFREADDGALTTFARLAAGELGGNGSGTRHVTETLLRLLDDGTRALTACDLHPLDAISLVGRALFTRFLGDRHLLPAGLADRVTSLFADPVGAQETSSWLDLTFNGDFLPLRGVAWAELPPAAFRALTDILFRAPGGQLHLGWDQGWGYLDFAHVPVGVLSRAYEAHVREYDPDKSSDEGVYYTPPAIAERMVRESFVALAREGSCERARVLDPAVGAGVFLLSAYRHLVAARWRADGARPDTATLREILYGQLAGFDISEEALRFAALGLYLIAIELDPDPRPVEKLGFTNLRGAVLFNVRDTETEQGRCAGSLGAAVGEEHAGRYDLVIGNPPWTGNTSFSRPEWAKVLVGVARATADLGLPRPPPVPNEVQDLPFVWRAREWCRPGGRITLALHGRLLFQQGEGMPEARRAVFAALDVTGVVNGAELRYEQVWPGINAPFCLLFAVNRRPGPASAFRYVSPRVESPLNARGQLRIDASRAPLIATDRVQREPFLFKVLFRGTELDRELLQQVRSRPGLLTLSAYWAQLFGSGADGRPNQTGNGYMLLRKSSRTKKGETLPGDDARHLWKYKVLPTEPGDAIVVDTTNLPLFQLARLHHARGEDIYRGPVVLVRKAPRVGHNRVTVSVSVEPVVYSQSVYGYSAFGHPQALLLARYVALLTTSRVALWYLLVTSGELGFERSTVEKATFDQLPIVRLEELSSELSAEIDPIFDQLAARPDDAAWRRVDGWAARAFGLKEADLQVVDDTLAFQIPVGRHSFHAQAPASAASIQVFTAALQEALAPWLEDQPLEVRVADTPSHSPWVVLRLAADGSRPLDAWPDVLRAADRVGATEVFVEHASSRVLWIGRLRHARLWTRSEARLCARHVVWRHLPALLPPVGDDEPVQVSAP